MRQLKPLIHADDAEHLAWSMARSGSESLCSGHSNQNALNTSKVTDSVSASLFESITICLASQSHGSEVSLLFNATLRGSHAESGKRTSPTSLHPKQYFRTRSLRGTEMAVPQTHRGVLIASQIDFDVAEHRTPECDGNQVKAPA